MPSGYFRHRTKRRVVEVRDADMDDIPQIQRVAWTTWHHTYRDTMPERIRVEFLNLAYSPASLRRRIGSNVFPVAVQGGSIVGFADFRPLPDGRMDLAAIYVLPEEQGRGIGVRLLRAGVARFPGTTGFVLRVERDNARARRFYEAHGFRESGEVTEEVFGHEVEMRLGPDP